LEHFLLVGDSGRYRYLEIYLSQEKLQLPLFWYNFVPRKCRLYVAVAVPPGKTPLTPSNSSNKDEFI
jgi:hypothetical protein